MVSPSSRQAEMLKKSTSSLRDLTRFTAIPKEQTGIPSLVKRNSGSLVMLPASTTRLKLTTTLPPFVGPAKLTIQEHCRFSSAAALERRCAERVSPVEKRHQASGIRSHEKYLKPVAFSRIAREWDRREVTLLQRFVTATFSSSSLMVAITSPSSSLRNTLTPARCSRSRVSGVGWPYGLSTPH